MENLGKRYQEEFERCLQEVDDSEFQDNLMINYSEVLKAHFAIAEYFHEQGEHLLCGVKSFDLLSSALCRQLPFFGKKRWNRPEEFCATLFYGINKNHAFHDANKRTALLTLIYQLYKHGKTFDCQQQKLDDLAVSVANSSLKRDYGKVYDRFEKSSDPEIYFLAHYIRRNTRPIDRNFYAVTYQEFNRLLNRYNVFLENPSGGFIDVVKYIEEKKRWSLWGNKSELVKNKLLQIGFPGWKQKIGAKAEKEVLKAAGLTIQNGVDAHVFFQEKEPLEALINEYSQPLKRLQSR